MHCVARLNNTLHNFFNNREINSIVTTLLIIVSLYISLITLLGENFLQPLADHVTTTQNDDVTVRSIFCHFSPTHRISLGILIRNVGIFGNFFVLPPFLETIIRKLSLVNIVIRWGLATDAQFLYENSVLPVTIGLVSAVAEIIAVTIASYFILNISFVMAIFCGLILTTVSPAVTVPAMINFKEENKGALKQIPDNILAICCVDNLFCVIVFMILSSIMFTDAPIATTILLNAGTVVFGVVGGLILGWILWRFPRSDAPHTQFSRILLLGTISISLLIGTFLIKYSCSGFLACLILSAMCAIQWKADNKDKLQSVESTYKYIWDAFGLPLLFVLLGMKFDCTNLTWDIVFLCIGVIATGLLIRVIMVTLVTLSSHINVKEQIVVALSLLPRATFQADLAPTLVVLATPFPEYVQDAALVLKVCILSVLLTAPLFDVLLNIVGSKFLDVHTPQHQQPHQQQQLSPPPIEKSSYFNGDNIDDTTSNVYTSRPKTYSEYRTETVIERY
ncbi:unnamed protein product [Caenorhabditis angaria]|uniref:Cation/H+ exchanger transmembrane domain-containing protein n=1 Tax=Caenorhabditis angaria TaxID=860376 RepID=A0A9P1J216_9PELO|nr:unnamed protein product [Caenorhabditis angaria]